MTPTPWPQPTEPYRGPLRWLEGVPDTTELAVIGALLLAGLGLLLIARGLFGTYVRDFAGAGDPRAWQLLWGFLALGAGSGSLLLLWLQIDHLAARMGMPIALLALLLWAEVQPKRGRRRRRR